MSIKKRSGLTSIIFGVLIILALVIVGLNLIPSEKGESPSGGEVTPVVEDDDEDEDDTDTTETKKPVAEEDEDEEETETEVIDYTPVAYYWPPFWQSNTATPAAPATEPAEEPAEEAEEEPEELAASILTIISNTNTQGLRFFLKSNGLIADLGAKTIALATNTTANISHSTQENDLYDSFTWSSNNTDSITIDNNVITANTEGPSTITLTACVNGTSVCEYDSFSLSVVNQTVNLPGISLIPNNADDDISYIEYSIETDNLFLTENGFALGYEPDAKITMHAADSTGEVNAEWDSNSDLIVQGDVIDNVFIMTEPESTDAQPTTYSVSDTNTNEAIITVTDAGDNEADFTFIVDDFAQAS